MQWNDELYIFVSQIWICIIITFLKSGNEILLYLLNFDWLIWFVSPRTVNIIQQEINVSCALLVTMVILHKVDVMIVRDVPAHLQNLQISKLFRYLPS
jgi:hypothetical protein